ncbi:MAG: pyridoxamine 5'-phosphate oxidase family protein [Lachnospiraceae bacterium]|nr:pyridoxamine 5'-phosphate oxidase family protein [Lachnospiraceae bacterium]
MFRELTRINKKLSQQECVEVLKNETRGVLSVLGDDDYPYGMPMNHWYNEEDGKIYFHCGKVGHRQDALRKHNKVSLCVYDKGYRNEGEWAWNVKSVIVFGKIAIIDDIDMIVDITTKLSYKFTQDKDYIEKEIKQSGPNTLLLQLTPEHICGKLVTEA